MSASELFALRNKLLKNSFEEFRKIVRQQKIRLDGESLSHLLLVVYQQDYLRKELIKYLQFFAEYDHSILHIEIGNRRRLLQQLCFIGKVDDIRELLRLFEKLNVPLKLYQTNRLVSFALQGKNNSDVLVAIINQLMTVRKSFAEFEDEFANKEMNYICLRALEKGMLTPALQVLRYDIGRLDQKHRQLFTFPEKIKPKDIKVIQDIIKLYLEKKKCGSIIKNESGINFLSYLPNEVQNDLKEFLESQEAKIEQKQQVRRSQNKVRSSVSQGQNFKQYNSEAWNQSPRERIIINIQSQQDEFLIQKEANKIYENRVEEKEKYFKYEKKQKKEEEKQKRVGIMKSQELRFYLEEEIKNQVQAIKEENRQYKCHFDELIEKLKEKLSAPLRINLEVFGSFRTGLCLHESDIDIAITTDNKDYQENPLKLLSQIQFILQQQDMRDDIDSVKFIKSATVPIIKATCTHKYLFKKIDFTYQDASHNGLQSVELIQRYKAQYAQLQSLIFVLKKFIYLSNLSAPYLGGISSYGLVLMIIAYIQQEYKNHDGQGQKLLTADLLIGFLKFYGFKMNYVMKCIVIFDKNKTSWQNYTGCLSRYNEPNGLIDVTPKLVILDPLNENNNVGRATHKIKQIQMAFQIAYISIHTFRQCGKKRNCPSFRKISRLQIPDKKYSENVRPCCILKRMFSCTEKFIKEGV